MSQLQTDVITAISGIAAVIFAVGAVYLGIPAARMAIKKIGSMLS